MARTRRTLRFPEAMEALYESATGAGRARASRHFLAVCLVADILGVFLDALHGSLWLGMVFRIGGAAPCFVIGILLLSDRRPAWQQGLLAAGPVLAGLCSIVAVGMAMGGRFAELYLSAAGMAGFLVNCALPLRIPHAAWLALANIACTTALVLAYGGSDDPAGLGGTLAFNAVGTLLTLGLALRLERSNRDAFLHGLQDRLLRQELQAANAELAKLVVTDPLTGLANRRAFDAALVRSRTDAVLAPGWFGLLLIDVDCFKAFNDAAGHSAGDECLRIVAQTLTREVRAGIDTAARYGGEEFAVVMPGADAGALGAAGERIRAAIEARTLPHPGRSPGSVVTVSVGGAAAWGGDGIPADRLVHRADAALYSAKGAGRNATAIDGIGSVGSCRPLPLAG